MPMLLDNFGTNDWKGQSTIFSIPFSPFRTQKTHACFPFQESICTCMHDGASYLVQSHWQACFLWPSLSVSLLIMVELHGSLLGGNKGRSITISSSKVLNWRFHERHQRAIIVIIFAYMRPEYLNVESIMTLGVALHLLFLTLSSMSCEIRICLHYWFADIILWFGLGKCTA